MSTDYKAMLESTSNHQPTVSSTTCTVLLCCPFCGDDAALQEKYSYVHRKVTGIGVACSGCNMGNIYKDLTQEEAIKAWNKRAS